MGPPLQGRECWVRSAGEGVVGPPCRGGSAGFALQGREWWVHPAGEGVVGPPCRGGSGGSALQGRENWVHLYREGGMGPPCRGGSVGSALQGRESWVHPAGRECWVHPAGSAGSALQGVLGPPCRGGRGGSALQGRERWVRPAGEGEVGPPCREAWVCPREALQLQTAIITGCCPLHEETFSSTFITVVRLAWGCRIYRREDVWMCVCVCVRAVCSVHGVRGCVSAHGCAWCASVICLCLQTSAFCQKQKSLKTKKTKILMFNLWPKTLASVPKDP